MEYVKSADRTQLEMVSLEELIGADEQSSPTDDNKTHRISKRFPVKHPIGLINVYFVQITHFMAYDFYYVLNSVFT
jgi:hypothetical protein